MSRYEYRLTREYNWNVKNKASKGYEVSLLFVTRWNDTDKVYVRVYNVTVVLPLSLLAYTCSPQHNIIQAMAINLAPRVKGNKTSSYRLFVSWS